MRRTHVWTLAVTAIALVALGVAAIASAALPTPNHALVVPYQGFGKVKLGISKSRAFDLWGQGMCAVGTGGRDTCVWLSNDPNDYPEEGTALELTNGKVCGMFMRAGSGRDGSLTITRLKRWKTEEGVGLGSRMRAAKHVLGGRTIRTRHHITTAFFPGRGEGSNKVEEIRIFKQGCEVT